MNVVCSTHSPVNVALIIDASISLLGFTWIILFKSSSVIGNSFVLVVNSEERFRGLFSWKAQTCLNNFTIYFLIAELDENPDQAYEIEMKDNPVYDSHRSGHNNLLPKRKKETSSLM